MAENGASKLAKYFDVSSRDSLLLSFNSVTSDKHFTFSGPAEFSLLGESTGHELCPLLFTAGFSARESRQGGGSVPILGSTDTYDLPSGGGVISLSITGYSVVTGDPKIEGLSGSSNKYNLLKRIYYDPIQYNNNELLQYFVSTRDGGLAENLGFTPITTDLNGQDIIANFAHSEFYEIPVGILSITLTKCNADILVTYYENCKVRDPGALMDARAGAPANFQNAIALTAKKVKLLKWSDVQSLTDAGSLTNEATNFINSLGSYLGVN